MGIGLIALVLALGQPPVIVLFFWQLSTGVASTSLLDCSSLPNAQFR